MDWLRDELVPKFEAEAAKYLKDPWLARNNYIYVVLDRTRQNIERFLSEIATRTLTADEKRRVLKLLEMQRQSMLMYTSCGWFFDEISGIETVQVMMYAARAIQLAQQVLGLDLENQFVKMLEQAPSNITEFENGAKVYSRFVKQAVVDLARIAAQGTILQLFSNGKAENTTNVQQYGCCFTITNQELEKHEAGKFRLAVNRCIVQSAITLDEESFVCAAIWLGDHNVSCGVKADADKVLFDTIKNGLLENFSKGEVNETILSLPKHFGNNNYSLKDVFKDDRMRILNIIVQDAAKKAEELNEIIYRDNFAFLRFMNEVGEMPPRPFQKAAEIVLNSEIRKKLKTEEIDLESLRKLISDGKALSIEFESDLLSLEASARIADELKKLLEMPIDAKRLEYIDGLIEILNTLPVKLELWHAQNIAFEVAQKIYKPTKEKNDENSKAWISNFDKLCKSIGIKLD